MSIQAVAWVLEHSESTGPDRLVLIAIANHANAGWDAWPAVEQIAREAGVARATVFRSLSRLVDSGELEVLSGAGRGQHNSYRVKGSHCETPGVSLTQIKGLTGATHNRQEPSKPSDRGSHTATPTPRLLGRCVACDKLEMDCLCDRGPLIQGVGR